MHYLIHRATFANVTALVALVVAISGSAYAAATIKSADIVDNQVKSVDVRDDSSRGGGLTGNDIREDTLGSVPGADTLDGLDSNAFLRNTGKAADADLLDGMNSSAFLGINDKAADANLIDGLDSSAFLRTTGKAADANLLDGVDSSAFVRGTKTQILSNRFVMANEGGTRTLLTVPGLGRFDARCQGFQAAIFYINDTAGPVDFWWLNGEEHHNGVTSPNFFAQIATDKELYVDDRTSVVVGLGTGDTPANFRTATVHAFALKERDGWPCGFQIEATLSTG